MRMLLRVICALGLVGCQTSSEPSVTPASQQPLVAPTHEEAAPEERAYFGPTQADEPPRMHEQDNRDVIEFSPSDLSTAAEGTFPTVIVPFRGLNEEEAARLATQFELVTWPEREVVATVAHYLDDAMEGGPTHARVVLEPRESLTDRWYALRARLDRDSGQARLRTRERQDAYMITDTHAYARFRVGSQPIVQRIDIASAADGEARVIVGFSERMRVDGHRLPAEVAVEGRALDCRLLNPDEARDESGSIELGLACSGARPGARVTVHFSGSPLVSVRTVMENDRLQHSRGPALVGAGGSDGTRDVFELDLPTIPEARLVSPSASDEERQARWFTATARSSFGFDPRELARSAE